MKNKPPVHEVDMAQIEARVAAYYQTQRSSTMRATIYALLEKLREEHPETFFRFATRRPIGFAPARSDDHPWWSSEDAQQYYESLLDVCSEAGMDIVALTQEIPK